jgi:hypothetical protein
MCLPYTVSDKVKKTMCNNFNNVNTYRSFDECIFENNDKNTSLQTLIFSIVIFIVGSISTLIIYYNVSVRIFIIYFFSQIMKTGEPPFNLPENFPEFLIPAKINLKLENEDKENRLNSTYLDNATPK